MKAEMKHFNRRVGKSKLSSPTSRTKSQTHRKQNRKDLVAWTQSINPGDQESQKKKKGKWKIENFPGLKDTEPPEKIPLSVQHHEEQNIYKEVYL